MDFHCADHGRSVAVLLALICLLWSPQARSAPVVLEDLEFSQMESEWELRVLFSIPVRYLRHSPNREGSSVEVAVEPLGRVGLRELLASGPEVLQPPERGVMPLRDVRIELGGDGRPLLLLRFWHDVRFRIEPGADFRSITFFVQSEKSGTAARPAGPHGAANGTADEIMEEARSAMVAREYDRAIALYTIALRSPAPQSEPHAREALEYLGLARQRNGQLAHARAEYEEYLTRFPEGEGSDRVRQRLAALATARAADPDELEPADARAPSEFDLYGSIYSAFFRSESLVDLSGAELVDSSQLLDADATARMRRGSLDLRGRASGYWRYDYKETKSDTPSRVTRLYLEARDRERQAGGIVGRQPGQGAGVLGRLDGVTANWTFLPDWTLKGAAGFPLLSSVSKKVETSQQVFGMSIETKQLLGGLSAEFYGVGQLVDGTTDRAAIGSEARYLDERRSGYGLLDFDVHFAELNIAMFSGSWRVSDATTINGLVDYRYSPVLTTRNALIGLPYKDLDELEDVFSDSEIKDFAKDRTSRVTTLMAGASHRINNDLEANGDFTATKIGSTDSSGGVPGFDSTDWLFYYTAQLVSWGWLMEDGSERIGLRIFDGDRYDSFTMSLGGRYPLPYDLRLKPELRFAYRDNDDTQNFIELDPRITIEYRTRRLVLDADFVLQWIKGVGSSGSLSRDDELGYILNIGMRYDF